MTRFTIAIANIRRRRLRTSLTMVSVLVTFFLFGFLDSIRYGLERGVEIAGADRLLTVNKVSVSQPLPIAYMNRLARHEAVEAVTHISWLAAFYQNEQQQIRALPIDVETYFNVYNEMELPPDILGSFRSDRMGALIGEQLAFQHGWKTGDRIPVQSGIYRNEEGGNSWPVNVHGVFKAPEGSDDSLNLLMHYDYFNESRTQDRNYVGWYVVNLRAESDASKLAKTIDQQFANSAHETDTSSEQDMALRLLNQIGNVGRLLLSISAVALLVMVIYVVSTLMQAVHEREDEIWLLQVLGFSRRKVASLELWTCTITVAPAAFLGLALAYGMAQTIGPVIQSAVPGFGFSATTLMLGIAITLSTVVIGSIVPTIRVMRS